MTLLVPNDDVAGMTLWRVYFHLCASIAVGISVYEKIPEPFGPILERSAGQELCVWSGRQFVVLVNSVMFATSSMASSFRAMVTS